MIQPRSLSEILAASELDTVKTAIVAELARLLPDVTIVAHPGKLDINDVVAKQVVAAPGVAIGWTRARAEGQSDGGHNQVVDWAAYIVAEDYSDLATNTMTPRDAVAHAIGSAILEVLGDPDLSGWGVPGLDMPVRDPGPVLTPLFTARSFEEGLVYFAVTWSQTLWRQGRSMFGGATPAWGVSDAPNVAVDASFPLPTDDALPPEIQALAGRFFGDGDV